MKNRNILTLVVLCAATLLHSAAAEPPERGAPMDKFRDLNELLPAPNSIRTASGAPGHAYWQQRVDYRIRVSLDEKTRRFEGFETVTYHNNSPDALNAVWMHLDLNRYTPDSDAVLGRSVLIEESLAFSSARELIGQSLLNAGMNVSRVTDLNGQDLPHETHGTLMRIQLPEALQPGGHVQFSVQWTGTVPEYGVSDRVGFQHFAEDGNDAFAIAKFYPRMVAYTDIRGWHNQQFLGAGEFTLEFGNFDVEITVPEDHIVAATGELQNPEAVLNAEQRERLAAARTSDRPVFVVTREEAEAKEKDKSEGTRTWRFRAEQVRDFAFASSRKFVWDAMGHRQEGGPSPVLAMSFYPKEGMPLWDKYSTHAIVHALEVYSEFTFPYPYPVAQSVMAGLRGGMEFPMITFNGPHPEKDKKSGEITYSFEAKSLLILVVIHEIGHQYFPMVVNSDERQWYWLDEGLNTYLEMQSTARWEKAFSEKSPQPAFMTVFEDAANYMKGATDQPIMTRADAVHALLPNAYLKPCVALTVLRETIMGRERFDRAFKEYALRWKFKRATPADFFRTMNDVGGMDLDWFWHGWFFTTDHLEFAIENVRRFSLTSKNPETEADWRRKRDEKQPRPITVTRNEQNGIRYRLDRFPELADFYNQHDGYFVTDTERKEHQEMLHMLEPWQRELLDAGHAFYSIQIANKGGLLAPLILRYEYDDGSSAEVRYPAEIWRSSPDRISIFHLTKKQVERVVLDPDWELPLAERHRASFPQTIEEERLDLTDDERPRNLMREVLSKAAQATESTDAE
jgi:hypothetical protein